MSTPLYSDSLDLLGVLLEQLEGLTAVGTQANFDELSDKETRFYMYGVHDLVLRCNEAYMGGRCKPKDRAEEASAGGVQ